jgi:hypothetical protein
MGIFALMNVMLVNVCLIILLASTLVALYLIGVLLDKETDQDPEIDFATEVPLQTVDMEVSIIMMVVLKIGTTLPTVVILEVVIVIKTMRIMADFLVTTETMDLVATVLVVVIEVAVLMAATMILAAIGTETILVVTIASVVCFATTTVVAAMYFAITIMTTAMVTTEVIHVTVFVYMLFWILNRIAHALTHLLPLPVMNTDGVGVAKIHITLSLTLTYLCYPRKSFPNLLGHHVSSRMLQRISHVA